MVFRKMSNVNISDEVGNLNIKMNLPKVQSSFKGQWCKGQSRARGTKVKKLGAKVEELIFISYVVIIPLLAMYCCLKLLRRASLSITLRACEVYPLVISCTACDNNVMNMLLNCSVSLCSYI